MDLKTMGLREVPTAELRTALTSLHRGDLECPFTIVGLTRVGLQHRSEPLLRHLRGLDEVAVRAVLVAVLAERAATDPR